MTPKEKLRKYWSQYLQEQDKYLDFKDWLENTDIHNYVKLTLECGFSTTSECRKALFELENKHISNDEYLIKVFEGSEKKLIQETTTSWDEIYEKFKKEWQDDVDLLYWLKENYHPPVKNI